MTELHPEKLTNDERGIQVMSPSPKNNIPYSNMILFFLINVECQSKHSMSFVYVCTLFADWFSAKKATNSKELFTIFRFFPANLGKV